MTQAVINSIHQFRRSGASTLEFWEFILQSPERTRVWQERCTGGVAEVKLWQTLVAIKEGEYNPFKSISELEEIGKSFRAIKYTVPALIKILKDKEIRSVAFDALSEISDYSNHFFSFPNWFQSPWLKGADIHQIQYVIELLDDFSTEIHDFTAIREALKDPNEDVRYWVARFIRELTLIIQSVMPILTELLNCPLLSPANENQKEANTKKRLATEKNKTSIKEEPSSGFFAILEDFYSQNEENYQKLILQAKKYHEMEEFQKAIRTLQKVPTDAEVYTENLENLLTSWIKEEEEKDLKKRILSKAKTVFKRLQDFRKSLGLDLIYAIQDNDEGVRYWAAAALGYIDRETKECVPEFIEALQHENSDVRYIAAFMLGRLGEDAKAAIPALRKCSKDKCELVRYYTGLALYHILD